MAKICLCKTTFYQSLKVQGYFSIFIYCHVNEILFNCFILNYSQQCLANINSIADIFKSPTVMKILENYCNSDILLLNGSGLTFMIFTEFSVLNIYSSMWLFIWQDNNMLSKQKKILFFFGRCSHCCNVSINTSQISDKIVLVKFATIK